MVSNLGKVSVVIPVFNSVAYLLESVRSVVGQTYENWELLIVDDGSTDDVAVPVLALGDSRVRIITQKRAGNYFARNRGISEAKGEFIAFLDADDLWTPDKLKKQMAIFEKDPSVAASFTDHYIFEDGAPEKYTVDLINTYPNEGSDQEHFTRRLLEGNFLITSSAVIRQKCLHRLGPFDTAYQNAMDYDMWLRIVMNYKVYYLTDRLVLRRIHPANISRNRVNTMAADKYTFEKLLAGKDKHDLFIPEYESIIEKRKLALLFHLGLEYLAARDFENAAKRLAEGRAPGRELFRYFALMTARTRSNFFLSVIQRYRQKRQRSKLKPK